MSGGLKIDKRTGKLKVSEADIKRTCTALLELDGWRALKTDPVSDRGRGKGFGELGMADCLFIRYGPEEFDTSETGTVLADLRKIRLKLNPSMVMAACQVMWIEWKVLGGKPSSNQSIWHDGERRRGALTLIAGKDFPASIEGFREYYRSSGLMRRNV